MSHAARSTTRLENHVGSQRPQDGWCRSAGGKATPSGTHLSGHHPIRRHAAYVAKRGWPARAPTSIEPPPLSHSYRGERARSSGAAPVTLTGKVRLFARGFLGFLKKPEIPEGSGFCYAVSGFRYTPSGFCYAASGFCYARRPPGAKFPSRLLAFATRPRSQAGAAFSLYGGARHAIATRQDAPFTMVDPNLRHRSTEFWANMMAS